ncbi:glycoside hydrolase family 5 [Lecanosticta acicola]|uniref:Glycoside hydrolase family 5 n=1 Tax=Lecanosticta acicola TaxID=111012 RepID=A0AAI9EDP0_9PEZI|nr:glycoside hydrolase family 5 [Lecanosticta acicola]
MRKFMDKAKSAFDDIGSSKPTGQPQSKVQVPMQDGQCTIQPPTSSDVFKYRYHHGVNLGSIFILERWLTGCMFNDKSQGTSELASVESWVQLEGTEAARNRFEKHWKEYVSDADLDWLKDVAKCTTVRLPIGYFTLGAPYCKGTPFEHVAPVYQNAWQAVRDLVKRCHARGIGTLIDLHGLPGGANGGEHSGTNSGKAGFWGSGKFRELATRCICFIVQQARNMEGVAGVQLVNEADTNAKGMYEWYTTVLSETSKIDASMPIYISDGWDLTQAATWTQQLNSMARPNTSPVVIDTHLYWCFTPDDARKSPQQITGEVWTKLHENELKDGRVVDQGASQAVVGEYSCVLGEECWAKGGGEPREALCRKFGSAQSQRYQQRAGGSFFWTSRMDWMPGGEWGFKQMTEQNAIVAPASLALEPGDVQGRINSASSQRDFRRGNTWGAHCQYWDTNHPGHYEHERFARGWDVGFEDAAAFFGMRSQHGQRGADKIGMLDVWTLKRLRESGQGGPFVWEYEDGFRQGIADFYGCVGV